MKKLVLVVMAIVMLGFSTLTFAGEVTELQFLQMKARALVAEDTVLKLQAELSRCRGVQSQQDIQGFIKELDQKGFMANQEGNVVEKPKAQTPLPPIPPVVPKVEKK
jgi:hypothetical protein